MKIKIICLGKIKESYLKDGINEYKKRISRFADVEIIELTDEKIPDNSSTKEMKEVLKKEGEKILNVLKKDDYIIPLCIEGKMLTSVDLAEKFKEITLSGKSCITFIIGGSLGLSEDVKNTGHFKLSFSKMTFPHQLMRLVLTEQVYRAFKINSNQEYHK